MDQIWLARHVWPIMRANVCEHGFRQIQWMAESWTESGRMGRGYTVDEKPRTDHGS
jgi:hypothetical protein